EAPARGPRAPARDARPLLRGSDEPPLAEGDGENRRRPYRTGDARRARIGGIRDHGADSVMQLGSSPLPAAGYQLPASGSRLPVGHARYLLAAIAKTKARLCALCDLRGLCAGA